MSLCPKCDKRPRRKPGGLCQTCHTEQNKLRRRAIAAGAPKKRRVASEQAEDKRYTRPLSAQRYLITSAQNATGVHSAFWETLEVAAAHMKAELVVVPFRYKNPTSVWTNDQERDDWWASETEPHLYNVRKKLNDNLILAADIKIQPTASSPLSGFESLTGAESCIIGHPKMQLRSIAVPGGRYPKLLTTTGCCTRKNYVDSKAGKLGSFHHHLGAIVVEIVGKKFRLRQIEADSADGSFTDLNWHYTVDGAVKAPRAKALVMGDTHVALTSKQVDNAHFGKGGMVEVLDPETLVWEDVLDGYAVNPHHYGNPFIAQAKRQAKMGDIRKEIEQTVAFVAERTVGRKSILVASNHNHFLSRWIVSTDWRQSPENAAFYLETAMAMLSSVKMGDGGTEYLDPFIHWVNKLKGKAEIRCLAKNESCRIAGIELSLHGHEGPNGSRGTLRNLARLGVKVVSAHTHTPGIEEWNYQVGTSGQLQQEYMSGPSSHQNADCIIYDTGARSLLFVIDGEWHTPIQE